VETRKVLDTNLLIEGETGLTTIFNVIEYPKVLEKSSNNEIIWPTRRDYLTAIGLMVSLMESGKLIPAIDVLICAVCLNRKFTLVTKDQHFNYVKSVEKGLYLEFKRKKVSKKKKTFA
jgi:tRNA(fMet)-specific endonuclease VapC